MKYSIIVPYYDRPTLHNTLVSFAHHYADRNDYEVIIIEDYKNVGDGHRVLLQVLRKHRNRVPIRRIEVGVGFKDYYNSAPLINLGVKEAQGQFIVLTSPECFHQTDVLGGFDSVLDVDPDAYVIAAVANADFNGEIKQFTDFKYTVLTWYQHSIHRNRRLHFCSALSKSTYNRIGGFDEGYAYGFWRDDVDFIETAIRKGVRIITRDDIVAVHQNHPPLSPQIQPKLIKINQAYYAKKYRKA